MLVAYCLLLVIVCLFVVSCSLLVVCILSKATGRQKERCYQNSLCVVFYLTKQTVTAMTMTTITTITARIAIATTKTTTREAIIIE